MLMKRMTETNSAELVKFDLVIDVGEDLKSKAIHQASVKSCVEI